MWPCPLDLQPQAATLSTLKQELGGGLVKMLCGECKVQVYRCSAGAGCTHLESLHASPLKGHMVCMPWWLWGLALPRAVWGRGRLFCHPLVTAARLRAHSLLCLFLLLVTGDAHKELREVERVLPREAPPRSKATTSTHILSIPGSCSHRLSLVTLHVEDPGLELATSWGQWHLERVGSTHWTGTWTQVRQ